MMRVPLPADWTRRVAAYPADGGPTGQAWLATVPGLLANALDAWRLVPDGPPMTGWTAIVVPVRRGGERLALKVTWPHPEGTHETLVLRHWAGAAAVRLVAADPARGVMLLELLDAARDLRTVPVDEACATIGRLLARLNVPAPMQLIPMADYLAPHLDRMAHRPAIPRRIVDRTRGLARDLLGPDIPNLLLHTDLHYENVLARDDEWVAIDPKGHNGDPCYELQPLLTNRWAELEASGHVGEALRDRFFQVVDAAGYLANRDVRAQEGGSRDHLLHGEHDVRVPGLLDRRGGRARRRRAAQENRNLDPQAVVDVALNAADPGQETGSYREGR